MERARFIFIGSRVNTIEWKAERLEYLLSRTGVSRKARVQ